MLARDMKLVDQFVVFQTVGRSAGWLPAAAALAKVDEDDAPHIILLPERAFDQDRFLADVKRCYDRYGWCSIVCGEGVCYADGTPISASRVTDKFANVEFGAMGGTSAADDAAPHDPRGLRLAGRVPGLRVAANVRRRPRRCRATWKRPMPAAAGPWNWPSPAPRA